MEYQQKLNQKYTAFFNIAYYVFIKAPIIQIQRHSHQLFCFLLFYISSSISRYHYSQILRTPFKVIRKNIFVTNFPFLMDSLQPPAPSPLPYQQKSAIHDKSFCCCSFLLLNIFKLFYLLGILLFTDYILITMYIIFPKIMLFIIIL